MSNENLTIDRPISGDVSRFTSSRVEQGTAAEFLAEIDAVLAIEGVEAVRWEQFTPYFNDGDACEFGAQELDVKFVGEDNAGDYEDGFVSGWYLGYENAKGEYPYRPETATLEQAKAFNAAKPNLDRYEDVLRENFGDPAQVTATTDGFSVEFYEHD